jgi:hypothetical protein
VTGTPTLATITYLYCMVNREYCRKIKDAYSDENLNKISAGIIGFYKSGEYTLIRRIAEAVSEYIPIHEEKTSKCFSRLIMIYHPDKGNQYRREIDDLIREGNLEGLQQYSHILEIQDLEQFVTAEQIAEDIDYHPEYRWEEDDPGFDYFYDMDDEQFDHTPEAYADNEPDNSFFSAVKRKLYGSSEIILPRYYLEDLEEIEMAEYEIEQLDGIECCKYVKILDLSGNNISDIYPLKDLGRIEELDLSYNQIGIIDVLYKLKNLRVLDMSNNFIDDLTPLLHLNNLEYLNIIGNPVPPKQIETLKNNGIIVVH